MTRNYMFLPGVTKIIEDIDIATGVLWDLHEIAETAKDEAKKFMEQNPGPWKVVINGEMKDGIELYT